MSINEWPDANVDCVLITERDTDRWQSLLERWGFSCRIALADRIADIDRATSPDIVFFDIRCPSRTYGKFLSMCRRWGDGRPLIIALLPSQDGTVSRADLQAADRLKADEFLVSESPTAVVEARVHYALLRLAGKADVPVLPMSAGLRMRSDSANGEADTLSGATRSGGHVSDHVELRERIETAVANTRSDMVTALVLINIDRFTRILTRFGKDRGDHLMALVLTRIQEEVADSLKAAFVSRLSFNPSSAGFPMISRLGLKEFAVLLPNWPDQAEATKSTQAILRAISEPLQIAGQSVYLTASAGIAIAPKDASDAPGLLSAAHSAVSNAKHTAGNSIAFYAPHLAANEAQKMDIEHRLREAMARGELEMYYQPQASVRTGEVVGVEALVRWNHPELGLVSPESFIPIAEEAGITVELGCWAIRSAIAEIGTLQKEGLIPLRLSINVSADMFADLSGDELARFLVSTLVDTPIAASQLTLEITERTIVDENGNAPRVIDELKGLGVRMALDDFGTGYSSLSYLKALPIDELKIDRSFIIGDDNEDRALLRAIISMANTLNMTVVAEGVETKDQLVRLYEEGCDLYQGYLCSPPVPGKDLPRVVKTTFAAFPG